MSKGKLLFVLGVVLLFAGTIAWRVSQIAGEPPPPPTVAEIRDERGVPVVVASAERGDLAVWRQFNGSVSGIRESVIRARSGDQIDQVMVEVGSRVTADEVVLRQRGEANLARLQQAEAAWRQASRTVERLRPLWEAGAVSDQDWDAAETQLDVAAANRAAAADILELKSPIDGVVTELAAKPGSIPDLGAPLVRVADLSALIVTLRVSSKDVAELRAGQLARTRSSRDDGVDGRVRHVALQADPYSRLIEVEVEFPGGSPLVPGTLATVQVLVDSKDDVVIIPSDAVRSDGTVWVAGEDNVALRRTPVLGLRAGSYVQVVEGVDTGEQVVVSGGSLLSEDAPVRIVNDRSSGSR